MQLYVGSLWNYAFQLYDETNNVPIDIAGMTFEFDIQSGMRRCPNVLLTIGAGITVLNAVEGILQVALTSDQTTQIGPGEFVGTLWRTDSDRQVLAVFSGSIDLPASAATYVYPWGYFSDYSAGAWP